MAVANLPTSPTSPAAPEQVAGASDEDRALLAETERWIQQAISVLARDARHQIADDLRNQLGRQPKVRPAVIVAGEDKRGKSSLVNALMRYPELSPTGVEVVTGAPIVLFRSTTQEAFFYRYGDTEAQHVTFEEARTLATVAGNPMNEQNIRTVHLGIDRELLDRFTVVDTPGVGGLESGHAALTLQSLRDADALLFVLEAGAQIRAEELAFLQTASARINRVVFAFTKVDIHRGWQISDGREPPDPLRTGTASRRMPHDRSQQPARSERPQPWWRRRRRAQARVGRRRARKDARRAGRRKDGQAPRGQPRAVRALTTGAIRQGDGRKIGGE